MTREPFTQRPAPGTETPLTEAELLERVAAGDIGWQSRGRGRMARLWKSETEYRLLTPTERQRLGALVQAGRVYSYRGVGLGARGPYDLTADERAARSRAKG